VIKTQSNKKYIFIWYAAGVAVLFIVWEMTSRLFSSALIFPGPVPVIAKFFSLMQSEKFLPILGSTFIRVLSGMLISVPAGLAFGIAAGKDKRAGAFLSPLFSLISSTPVMSVILIAFLFLGAEKTPVFTAFLMVFPVMAANAAEGIRRIDPRFRELFLVYKMSAGERLRYLYIPSITPFILGGIRSSLSLCWKVIVAAEVLVQPFLAIGTGMQQARAWLETPELFAWTLVTVISAALFQGILEIILRIFERKRSKK